MPTQQNDDELVRATLAAVAPGTELRDGLERILRGRTGALIVLGNDKVVETVSTGGFMVDIEFSATRLRELAKMDGGIVLTRDGGRIVRAATQLAPDRTIETRESGTRHRTAKAHVARIVASSSASACTTPSSASPASAGSTTGPASCASSATRQPATTSTAARRTLSGSVVSGWSSSEWVATAEAARVSARA